MEDRNLNSWSEFRLVVEEIRENGHQKQKEMVLFRGQKNSTWFLETTLERAIKVGFSVEGYLAYAKGIKPTIEVFTGKKWHLQDLESISEKKDRKSVLVERVFGKNLPWIEFLTYLRHHGYPSPLLDWSESPYIAAYFAFQELCSCELGCGKCQSELGQDTRVAIFAYLIDSVKSYNEEPRIQLVYPHGTTDARHYNQKSWYTVASKWSARFRQTEFCSHHEAFGNTLSTCYDQDTLIKITIPSSERKKALKELDDYNINHFTLFQTEDALVKSLSMKDFDLDER
jgi:hypothetical protein